MVDWSASSRPVTGKDSIWYCLFDPSIDGPSVVELENPSTRRQAMAEIRTILHDLASREKSVLIGFDFPLGYPKGFAAALGLTDAPPWLSVWR